MYRISEMSHEEICTAIHQHNLMMCRGIGNTPHSNMVDTPEIFYVEHGDKHPAYQGVVSTNLKPENVDRMVDDVVDYYSSRGLIPSYAIHPDCRPFDLNKRLEKKGFTDGGGAKAMACDLHAINLDRKKPEELSIETVMDDSMLRTFFDIWTIGYSFPQSLGDVFYRIIRDMDYGPQSEAVFYIGYYDDTPVATSLLFLDSNASGLWWVSTHPDYRGRGIGSEMTLQPLRDAITKGYHMNVLFGTEMGYPLYKKLGYKEYYTLKIYLHI